MFRDWEAIVGHLLFVIYIYTFFIHTFYYFYLKMVMKFGNFGQEMSWKSHEMLMQAGCGNPVIELNGQDT